MEHKLNCPNCDGMGYTEVGDEAVGCNLCDNDGHYVYPTHDEVIAALVNTQMDEWPQSEIISEQDVIAWALKEHRRFRGVLCAFQYPYRVWYRFKDDASPVMGCRTGLHGSDYCSGFSDMGGQL